jgi:hypothetical protein
MQEAMTAPLARTRTAITPGPAPDMLPKPRCIGTLIASGGPW